MKILVELNSRIDSFQIKERHRDHLLSTFPSYQFVFLDHSKSIPEHLAEADMALVWSFREEWYELAPKLKAVYTPAAGKDWVAEDPRGLVKTHFSTFHGQIISESFMGMLLFANGGLKTSIYQQDEKNWNPNGFGQRRLLRGQTLLILGFGNIARHCAKLALALGMKVLGTSRRDQQVPAVKIIHPDDFDDALPYADHVLNLLPGDASTHHFVGERHFELMKSGACFYNFGRGTTVDESALILALESGHFAFAGLDVTEREPLPADSPLWTCDKVLLTPHSSCCYEDYLDLFFAEWAGNH